ncbi:MAG: HEPN domain-containing protein [Desulfuromonadales bacterium]
MSVSDTAISMQTMAGKDLTALRGMMDTSSFADEIFGFHAQQAVEKSLKAWITVVGDAFGFTHDIELLLMHLKRLGVDADRFSDLIELSAFAVQFRYAELDVDDVPLDRYSIISKVTDLFSHVQTMLEEANHAK